MYHWGVKLKLKSVIDLILKEERIEGEGRKEGRKEERKEERKKGRRKKDQRGRRKRKVGAGAGDLR